MSYTVLARRYRSTTFDEVVGQTHIAQTLKKAIESGRIAHAYLFCGTRGTGKTSTARILAKCLNCQSADHPVAVPCNTCDSCKSIARGDDIDVIEIDAASNTGVDNVRDLINNSQYRPARSRFKIYIIDEVHMLSKSAFNALLKTLEEPPEHVKFILATTEPEKVLPTILSRCQRYDFRNIPTREIAGHLKQICRQEKIEADEDALLLIAKAGAGSMRDSLSLLDRLLSIGEKKLSIDMIEQLLGLPKSQLILDLAAAIGAGDAKETLVRAEAIINSGMSVDSVLAALADHLRNLMILRTCGPDSNLVEVPGLSMADLIRQAELFNAAALSQDIVILEELRRQIRQSQAGRALLDAALVRMALADQFASIGDLVLRMDGTAPPPDEKKKPTNRPAMTPPATPPAAPPATLNPPPLDPSPAVAEDDDDDLPAVGRVWEGPRPSLSSLMARHSAGSSAPPAPPPPAPSSPAPAAATVADPTDESGIWQALLSAMSDNHGLRGILSQAQYGGILDNQAIIRFAHDKDTFVKMLERNGKKDAVRDTISRLLGRPVGVRLELLPPDTAPQPARPLPDTRPAAPAAPPPPAAPPEPAAIRMTDEIRSALYESDPLIRAIVDQFAGTIIKLDP